MRTETCQAEESPDKAFVFRDSEPRNGRQGSRKGDQGRAAVPCLCRYSVPESRYLVDIEGLAAGRRDTQPVLVPVHASPGRVLLVSLSSKVLKQTIVG